MEAETSEGMKFLRSHSQAILHARYRIDQQIADSKVSGKFFEQDDVLFGARVRLGIDWASVSFEGAYLHADPRDRPTEDAERFTIGGDIRMAKNLWVNLSSGGQTGAKDQGNQGFVLSSLKYGFSSETPESLQ